MNSITRKINESIWNGWWTTTNIPLSIFTYVSKSLCKSISLQMKSWMRFMSRVESSESTANLKRCSAFERERALEQSWNSLTDSQSNPVFMCGGGKGQKLVTETGMWEMFLLDHTYWALVEMLYIYIGFVCVIIFCNAKTLMREMLSIIVTNLTKKNYNVFWNVSFNHYDNYFAT